MGEGTDPERIETKSVSSLMRSDRQYYTNRKGFLLDTASEKE